MTVVCGHCHITVQYNNPRVYVYRASLHSPEPAWTVRGLEWHVKFSVTVVAVNDKGRSPPAQLDDLVLTDPEQRTGTTPLDYSLTNVITR